MPVSVRITAATHDSITGVTKVRQVVCTFTSPSVSWVRNHAPTVNTKRLNGRLNTAA